MKWWWNGEMVVDYRLAILLSMPALEAGKLSMGPTQIANPSQITWAQYVWICSMTRSRPWSQSHCTWPPTRTAHNKYPGYEFSQKSLKNRQEQSSIIFPVFSPSWETTCSPWPLWPYHGEYKLTHAITLIASEFHVRTMSSLRFNGDSIWVSSRLTFWKRWSSAILYSKGTVKPWACWS